MGVTKPFFRTVRQQTDGEYAEGGRARYVEDPRFAGDGPYLVRAFTLIQQDLIRLFEYIEPDHRNRNVYSLRTYELLLRACTELETNFTAILSANTYSKKPKDWNIKDYAKIERSHFLSKYEVWTPYWTDSSSTRRPFAPWTKTHALPWYQAYNHAKHDRVKNMREATFDALIDAVCGLVVVLSAQFYTHDFGPGADLMTWSGRGDGRESAIGGYFRVKFPTNVPKAKRYDFDYPTWKALKASASPFDKIDYDTL